MTCENCIHYSLCESQCRNQYENGECAYCYRYFCEVKNTAEKCLSFKDKSLYIKLPCKVGEKAYYVKHNNIANTNKIESIMADEFGFDGDMTYLVYYDHLRGEQVYDVESVFLTREEAEKALKERESK